MKIFNPTPEKWKLKHHGIPYYVDLDQSIDVTKDTGDWIISHWGRFGIIDITPTEMDKQKASRILIQRILEGLEKYVQHCHDILECFMKLDTEMKVINVYGTVMKDKNVKVTTKNLEIAIRRIKEIEAKYGISIYKADMDDKVNNILSAIESIKAEIEADQDSVSKERERDFALNSTLNEVLGETLVNRF